MSDQNDNSGSNRVVATVPLDLIGLITFIIFMTLKLCNVLPESFTWFWVWFPLWIPFVIDAVVIVLAVLLGIIAGIIKYLMDK